MTIEDLKNHCEKQIDLCSKLNDYKHLEEHQLILNLIKENQELKERLEKIYNYLDKYYTVENQYWFDHIRDIVKDR